MELPSKIVQQITFNTEPKNEERMFIVIDKSLHEEQLDQPLQTNIKYFKNVVTFLTGYIGIFNITNKNKKFYFTVLISDDDFNVIYIPPGAYELESLENEIKRVNIRDGYFTQ